jgi:hypothetical protein
MTDWLLIVETTVPGGLGSGPDGTAKHTDGLSASLPTKSKKYPAEQLAREVEALRAHFKGLTPLR